MILHLMITLAFAREGADEELGRAQGLLAAERPNEAWQAATRAIDADPMVPMGELVYRDACEAAGLGARCAAEVKVQPAPWKDQVEAIGALVSSQQPAKSATHDLLETWPRHPEPLVVLWPATGGYAALGAAQGAVREHVKKTVPTGDAGVAWRSWMVLRVDSPEAAALPAERLRELAEGAVPLRRPWTSNQRIEQARGLVRAPMLPAGLYPSEVRDVAVYLSGELLRAGRSAEMLAVWAGIEGADAPYAAVHRALDAVRAKAITAELSDAAFAAASRPISGDLAVAAPVRRQLLSDAFLARAAATERTSRYGEAYVWRLAAIALAATPPDDAETERLRNAALGDINLAKKKYAKAKDQSFFGILTTARKALGSDPGAADAQAMDALLVLASGTTAGGATHARDLSEGLATLAEARENLGKLEEARTLWVSAVSLHDAAPAAWWVHRATLEEKAGDREAAFASWSRARARGESADAALQRCYYGPGSWSAAADALGR